MNSLRFFPAVVFLLFVSRGLCLAGSDVDPVAVEALKRMSATLVAAPSFKCRIKTIREVSAANGQFITLFSNGKVALKRPDKLQAAFRGSAPHFDFYFDGKAVSAFAPGANVYSTKPAPDSIDGMLAGLQQETGIRMAMVPLLSSDPFASLTQGLKSALVVGPTLIDGVKCDHLAFRSPGVNWEIWVESNSGALPRRLAVTFTDQTNFPRTLVDLSHWNLHPWFLPSFVFVPPAGAKEIPFTTVLKSSSR